jgi:hypothetical protein
MRAQTFAAQRLELKALRETVSEKFEQQVLQFLASRPLRLRGCGHVWFASSPRRHEGLY